MSEANNSDRPSKTCENLPHAVLSQVGTGARYPFRGAGLFWCSARCRRRATCFFKFCTALLLLCAPVSLECCRARSQLSNAHTITFQLVRSGENEPPDCLCAIRRSAPSQRGAFWWNFRLIFGSLNRPLEPHWHSLNRKICDL